MTAPGTLCLCGAGNAEGVRLARLLNRARSRWERIVLLDDDPAKRGQQKLGVPIVGPLSELGAMDPAGTEAVNLVARTTAGRLAVRNRIRASGIPFAQLVSPDVDTEGATLPPDLIAYQHATLGPEASIGEGTVVFMGAVIGHECRVGPGSVIAANAVLNARVSLGTGTYVGANATIIPEITVGEWATIGAGSLVVEDVPAGATVVGVPAELVWCDADHRQAPVPADPAFRTDHADPEQLVVRVWCDVLGRDTIHRDDNFFDLGGCSLLALQLRERLRQATGHQIALTDVYRFPSVRTLVQHLNGTGTSATSVALDRAASRRAAMSRRQG